MRRATASLLLPILMAAPCITHASAQSGEDDEVIPISPTTTSAVTSSPAPPASAASGSPAQAAAPLPGSVPAGDTPVLPPAEQLRAWDGFHLDLTAGAWFARVTGDVSAGGSLTFDLADDLGLTSQEVSFAGDIDARWRALHFRLSGSQFSTSGGSSAPFGTNFNGVVVRAGDPTETSLSMWNVGGDVGVDLWRPFADRPFALGGFDEHNATTNRVADGGLGGVGGYRADLRLGAFVGARAFNTDLDFSNLRTSQSTTLDETWTAIYVGGRVTVDIWLRDHFPLLERMSLDADGSFGPAYPGSGSYFQVRAGLTIYPCDNFGVQFGYRYQSIHAEGRGQDLDASFAGLFVGGVLHF